MFCQNCGKQLPDSAKFCSGCGQPVAAQESVASPAVNVKFQEHKHHQTYRKTPGRLH